MMKQMISALRELRDIWLGFYHELDFDLWYWSGPTTRRQRIAVATIATRETFWQIVEMNVCRREGHSWQALDIDSSTSLLWCRRCHTERQSHF